jgi:hypothetical protein
MRVRGDAHEDYDVAVFLRDLADRPAEMNRLADLSTKIIVEEDGPFIAKAGVSAAARRRRPEKTTGWARP